MVYQAHGKILKTEKHQEVNVKLPSIVLKNEHLLAKDLRNKKSLKTLITFKKFTFSDARNFKLICFQKIFSFTKTKLHCILILLSN